MKNKLNQFALFVLVYLVSIVAIAQTTSTPKKEQAFKIDLKGEWLFQMDSLDRGETEKWFNKLLSDKIKLPGSMTTNGKGNDISLNTPWTGQVVDSSWFFKPEYAQYRQPGNIKIPFWLQPVKYYKGAAWYQKTINIPASWQGKPTELFIERTHWETTVWIDNQEIGMQNSLGTAHVFQLGKALSPGMHRLTIRVDNRVKDFNVGQNSHSISDHTQSNWNGMIGKLYIKARPEIYISDVQLYPDIDKKQVVAKITIENETGIPADVPLQLIATTKNPATVKLAAVTKSIQVKAGSTNIEMEYPMGSNPLLWDEFQPNLYAMSVSIPAGVNKQEQVTTFGMRKFSAINTQFTINGRVTFLRGTLECAIFPKTGYPPTDVKEWLRIFTICRSYGLNHVRFHSWCPPEAAFEAADQAGFYLQIECSSWANQGATIGDGKPLDQYIYDESERMVKAYGNHPSFCMMAYGNEPAGNNMLPYLTKFVNFWKAKDNRRLYSNAAGWPVIPENDYHSTPDPRIQAWGAGLKSIINKEPPRSDYDWSPIISKWANPAVSHEIGQWCVYPDFKEIKKYTGVLKAKNFEIFKDKLEKNGLGRLADSFLLSSGKLQALCYKADIEAALRTPGFGGFQLLDLHDFPGQGTALVGVLNPFWEDKGYITGREYSRFCNAVVPLARLTKMVYQNDEVLAVPVEIANFGATPLQKITPLWNIKDAGGKVLYQGRLPETDIVIGNGISLGKISQSLSGIAIASRLTLTVTVGEAQNAWDLFVYPASLPELDVLTTAQLDARAIEKLNSGGSVLLTIKKGHVKDEKGGDIKIGFSSMFWNTAWTGGQPPVSLGILVNPAHPALQDFPTEYYSNWQWWDAMAHSAAIQLDSVAPALNPIVRVIDDWVTARSLGLVFECKVGKGKLMVSGIDLLSNQHNRPAAKQLLYSLQKYMISNRFNPSTQLSLDKIKGLMKEDL
ncbi:MAG: beta-galactosidase [Chitinophagaceae bacterium]|nr:beta-galactosidase [Chitinophagaceae bacterium]